RRLLVDCGMFQGSRELEEENSAELGFDPAGLDFLLLTHAHLDHCGRLPLLVRNGFRGEIIATAATRDLARIILQDAAHMAGDDAAWRSRRSGGEELAPLYTQSDVAAALALFGRPVAYGQELTLGEDLRVSFHDAGHILGSAHVLVRVGSGGGERRV